MFRWLREYARAKTLFMDPQYAAHAKNKLALVYALLGWNIFGVVIFQLFKEKVPKTHDSVDYAKMLGVKDAKVIKFTGSHKAEEYDIHLSDEELKEFEQVIGKPEEKEIYDKKNEERRQVAGKAKQ